MNDDNNELVLKIHKILPDSTANGPGTRSVIWTQGCSLMCDECFNQNTHDFNGGDSRNAKDLATELAALSREGITITGGEPLDQAASLLSMINEYKKIANGTILLFTGYSLDEIRWDADKTSVIKTVDAALVGRYKCGELWCNKKLVIITGRILPLDILPSREVEYALHKNELIVTGYPQIIKTR